MRCVLLILAIVTPIPLSAAEREEIPLESIWALNMPGTRDIRKLDPRETVNDGTFISRIGHALMKLSEEREPAGPCFLVEGEGKDALERAAVVIADKKEPAKTLSSGRDASLVFYSSNAPGYVPLQSVQHSAGKVTINYKIVPHLSAEVTVHFALIPLGKLPAGKLEVEVVQLAADETSPPGGTISFDPKRADRAVCDSCSFVIEDDTSTK